MEICNFFHLIFQAEKKSVKKRHQSPCVQGFADQEYPCWTTGGEQFHLLGIGYKLDLPPTQDASGKWRFWLGFPTKNVIILVVTVTGWGVDLRYKNNFLLPKTTSQVFAVKSSHLLLPPGFWKIDKNPLHKSEKKKLPNTHPCSLTLEHVKSLTLFKPVTILVITSFRPPLSSPRLPHFAYKNSNDKDGQENGKEREVHSICKSSFSKGTHCYQ